MRPRARRLLCNYQFGTTSVAQDRYRKGIHEHEQDRAESNYARSALAGAALGLALRKGKWSRGKAAAAGVAGGIAAQGAVRAATAGSRDPFGDRPLNSKRLERLPWQAAGVAAGAVGYKRLMRKAKKIGFSAADAAEDAGSSAAAWLANKLKNRHVQAGLALTGGIAAADAVTGAIHPDPDQSRAGAAASGLAHGAVYGAVLAGAEPLLKKRLTNAGGKILAGAKALSARRRLIEFGGSQQLRDKGNRFVDPLDVASGTRSAYHRDERGVYHPVDLPVQHAQVVRAALNKGRGLHRTGSRVAGLVGDAADAARGKQKVDSRGRPVKREWEKSWFKNAVGTTAVAGGLLAHAHAMRTNPGYRAKVQSVVRKGKGSANSVVPGLFPLSARLREVRFDRTAPDWDVRDQRGRSARVFAPGARPRERREKKWHERVDNIRRIATVGAIAAGTAGVLVGHRLGKASAAPAAVKAPASWQKPGYRTKKITVVGKKAFRSPKAS